MGQYNSSSSSLQENKDITKSKEVTNLLKLFNYPDSYFSDSVKVTTDKMLIMIHYLLNKHKNACAYPSQNNHLFDIGWFSEIKNGRSFNFNLDIRDDLVHDLLSKDSVICKDKRFILIPLYLHISILDEKITEAHQNILICDKERQTIERFEPYGYATHIVERYSQDILDKELKKYFEEFEMTYISPLHYCPERYGFQTMEIRKESPEFSHRMDPGGFCGFWSVFYADLWLTYPNISRKKLVNYAAHEFSRMDNMTRFIRNYGAFILENKGTIFEQKRKRKISLISKKQ